MRQRLLAGQEAKARRGELFKRLPIGYARDPVGKIMFHPDRRVCEAIQLVFAKFRELWSVRQTFHWFRDHDLWKCGTGKPALVSSSIRASAALRLRKGRPSGRPLLSITDLPGGFEVGLRTWRGRT